MKIQEHTYQTKEYLVNLDDSDDKLLIILGHVDKKCLMLRISELTDTIDVFVVREGSKINYPVMRLPYEALEGFDSHSSFCTFTVPEHLYGEVMERLKDLPVIAPDRVGLDD